uniref:DUF4203 domain-containing protein n=1 Tax=Leersia perrieri TaxID=77586 RepID=A0A0D9X518_9ORYZ
MTNLTTIGLLVIMVAVSASVSVHGSYGLLVGLLGVIVGSNLIYLGVKTAGNLVAIFLGTIASLVAKYPRRNFATVQHSFDWLAYDANGGITSHVMA